MRRAHGVAHGEALAQPQNEGMQQTKPAFFSVCAGFAADPRC